MHDIELLHYAAQIVPTIPCHQRWGPDSVLAVHRPAPIGWLALLFIKTESVESNVGPTWGRQQELGSPKMQGVDRQQH